MKKQVTVVHNGSRVSDAELVVGGTTESYRTDQDGVAFIDVDPGKNEIRITHENAWTEHSVTLDEESGPLCFDLSGARTTGQFLKQNTLNLGDRFVFDSVLGRGGMGIVVKAEDRVLRRSVAIKILSEELRDNIEAQDIFLSEGRSLAALSHPNLVSVFDVVSVNDRAMMVLEFINGETIEQTLDRDGKITPKYAVRYSTQLVRALGCLHENAIIHRDLKPANLMVLPDQTLKVIDFGLARSFDHLTIRSTKVRGSPAYMSPEQILGRQVTPQTDLYQFGVTVFEMITGELPFPAENISHSHVHRPAPRMSQIVSGIPKLLDDLVESCLQKDPLQRPVSAEAVGGVLTQISRDLNRPDREPVVVQRQISVAALTPSTHLDPTISLDLKPSSNRRNAILAVIALFSVAVAAAFVITNSKRVIVDEPNERAVIDKTLAGSVVSIEMEDAFVTSAKHVASARQNSALIVDLFDKNRELAEKLPTSASEMRPKPKQRSIKRAKRPLTRTKVRKTEKIELDLSPVKKRQTPTENVQEKRVPIPKFEPKKLSTARKTPPKKSKKKIVKFKKRATKKPAAQPKKKAVPVPMSF